MNKLLFFILISSVLFITACGEKSGDETPTPLLPQLSIGSVTLFEGNDNQIFRFQVSLSVTVEEAVRVDYTTQAVTATEGMDFVKTTGTLNIPAGQQTTFIEVEVLSDDVKEANEEFKVI